MIFEDPARNYVARQTFDDNGAAITIVKFRCDGFTEEHWNSWKHDPIQVQLAMNDRLMATRLAEVADYKCYHLQMRMPMMISNRSILTCFYEHLTSEGYRVVLHSSQGNEDLVESRRHHIGKDVVANNIITYMASKPYEGGMELN